KTLIDAGKLKVRIREGRMVVALATDVLFPSGSSTLSKDGKAAIAEVAGLLASIPDRKFQIEGHTDNVPVRGGQYFANWGLAANRALTVLSTMIDAGLPPERISAASFGDSAPAKPNDTPENRAANRRIEIVVVPDLASLPGFDELQRVSNQ
ncbi:MAG TPA: OmpA family protein, partial [Myxococcales bacterium]|nr:OmpA family protein [Myxococcales bacterium]